MLSVPAAMGLGLPLSIQTIAAVLFHYDSYSFDALCRCTQLYQFFDW